MHVVVMSIVLIVGKRHNSKPLDPKKVVETIAERAKKVKNE